MVINTVVLIIIKQKQQIMNKRDLWIYRVVTGLLTALAAMSATMYVVQYDMVSETFLKLGFPVFVIYPLATAKILGLVAIWTKKSKMLKEWAYAGFAFDFVLAVGAHLAISDGEFAPALVALVLLAVSYVYDRKLYTTYA